MTCAIGLVTDVVFGTATALVSATLIGAVFLLLWYILPLKRRSEIGSSARGH